MTSQTTVSGGLPVTPGTVPDAGAVVGLGEVPEAAPVLAFDRDWALDLYSLFARGGSDEQLFYVKVDGDPWSKSRPRFTRRGNTYQPRDDLEAEQRMAMHLRAFAAPKFLGNVMVVCRFYRSNFQRIDTDNLLKHVCDSANGILWKDDSQVTLVLGEVLYDSVRPRTVILVGNHESTLLRGEDQRRVCDHCGGLYMPAPGRMRHTQRFCGRACSLAGRKTALKPIVCKQCQAEFKPFTKSQVLCSPECRQESLRGRMYARRRPFSTCSECGAQLTHRRGGRCRSCWRANPEVYDVSATS